ncbi:MAG: recombination protein RecR [Clostridia bacterium]|nr:recombination protein RecR [Clostridia bacterium]
MESVLKLANEFSKLPGVGKKTAMRYAYYIIGLSNDGAKTFADSIMDVKAKVRLCEECGNFTEESPCSICKTRSQEIICVVKEPKDVVAIEKVKGFKGVYHVLHGTLSPMQHIGPNDIRIRELLDRVNRYGTKEVIMATNPDVEGDATALYIANLLKPLGIKVTRIAQGVSMGSELEFADEITLSRAIEDRRDL